MSVARGQGEGLSERTEGRGGKGQSSPTEYKGENIQHLLLINCCLLDGNMRILLSVFGGSGKFCRDTINIIPFPGRLLMTGSFKVFFCASAIKCVSKL